MNNVSQAGDLGGQMVEKVCSIRTAKYDRPNRIVMGHAQTMQYICLLLKTS